MFLYISPGIQSGAKRNSKILLDPEPMELTA